MKMELALIIPISRDLNFLEPAHKTFIAESGTEKQSRHIMETSIPGALVVTPVYFYKPI